MGRIMAVDLGTRRVGLALTDPLRLIASPLAFLAFRSEARLLEELLALVGEKDVERVVIGLPIREDGTEGEGCLRARSLARNLEARGVGVVLWDERYSSREAEKALREMGIYGKRSVGRVDPVAASIILEDYLRSVSSPKDPSAH